MALPVVFAFWGLATFVGFILFLVLANVYIILWALGEWGVVDATWQDEFVGSLWGWTEEIVWLNFVSDLISIPFKQIRFILTNLNVSDEGYHILFLLTVYPGLYLLMEQFSITNLFTMPILAFLYLILPEIFSDSQAILPSGREYLVPSEGIPTWFAAFYAVNSLLWGDYRYLDMNKPLEINFF